MSPEPTLPPAEPVTRGTAYIDLSAQVINALRKQDPRTPEFSLAPLVGEYDARLPFLERVDPKDKETANFLDGTALPKVQLNGEKCMITPDDLAKTQTRSEFENVLEIARNVFTNVAGPQIRIDSNSGALLAYSSFGTADGGVARVAAIYNSGEEDSKVNTEALTLLIFDANTSTINVVQCGNDKEEGKPVIRAFTLDQEEINQGGAIRIERKAEIMKSIDPAWLELELKKTKSIAASRQADQIGTVVK